MRLWWWEQPYPGNLGDIINPYIIEGLTGLPPKYAKSSPRTLAIGSIIKFAKKGDTVWGAGAPSSNQSLDPHVLYQAVRGPLTRQLVLKCGGDCPEVFGDPAWLLPLIYPRKAAAKNKLGLIRHFTHKEIPVELGQDVREIDIVRVGSDQIEAFLDEMLACEAIISSSLHGVIIANAYGIPAKLASATSSSRQIHGDGMKFEEYFLSIGVEGVVPLDLSGIGLISADLAALCVDNPKTPINLESLFKAAPFDVLPEVLARVDSFRVKRAA